MKTEKYVSLKHAINLLKFLPSCVILIYLLGYLIVSANLFQYGIQIYFLDTRIIAAGVLIAIIITFAILTLYACLKIIGKDADNIIIKVSIILFSSFPYSYLLFRLLFSRNTDWYLNPKILYQNNVSPLLVTFLLILLILSIIILLSRLIIKSRSLFTKIYRGIALIICISCFFALNYIADKILLQFSLSFTILCLFVFIGFHYKHKLFIATELLPYKMLILILFALAGLTFFGRFLWPQINPFLGGGKPIPVGVILKESRNIDELNKQNIYFSDSTGFRPVKMLYQTPNSYIFLTDSVHTTQQVVEINKDMIEALIYLH